MKHDLRSMNPNQTTRTGNPAKKGRGQGERISDATRAKYSLLVKWLSQYNKTSFKMTHAYADYLDFCSKNHPEVKTFSKGVFTDKVKAVKSLSPYLLVH